MTHFYPLDCFLLTDSGKPALGNAPVILCVKDDPAVAIL